MQVTFQAVLSSDGHNSFVTTIYDNLTRVRSIVLSNAGVIGFDAGDNSRGNSFSSTRIELEVTNTFRIDGKMLDGFSVLYKAYYECKNKFTLL